MPPDANPASTRVRRRIAYALIGVAVLLVLIITPPLVNVDRYRHRIAQTMSDSLGRPVHIDDVKLHLLPMPSLELRNVVVSEDPAFGSEPTIRANRVDAILRPSSLWRRRIEFSTIRFGVDDNGAGPSVNLVRNAAGRWNLDSVFMQAAHVTTAPTVQRTAGPAPRFPYIEATAARINLKLGEEKMPFSLTETDFALWLPEPDQWHVRLKGRPTRTDASLSETGLVRLEGTLHRAPSIAQIPVDLQATWSGSQLGEGTALLTGNDMGWRGTGTLNAALKGTLADAAFTSTLELHGLRRDFIPARTLDLTLNCQAHATVTAATLESPVCSLPTPAIPPTPRTAGTADAPDSPEQPGAVQLRAARFDLTSRAATDLRLVVHAPDAWLLDWARLFSPNVPPDENPLGAVDGSFSRVSARSGQPPFWTGVLQGTATGTAPASNPDATGGVASAWSFTVTGSPSGLDLAPVNLAAATDPPLALSGNINQGGYSVHLAGVGSPEQVLALANRLPPLRAGLGAALGPAFPAAGLATDSGQRAAPDAAQRIDVSCTRLWSASDQTCTVASSAASPSHPHGRSRRR